VKPLSFINQMSKNHLLKLIIFELSDFHLLMGFCFEWKNYLTIFLSSLEILFAAHFYL
jgi:hypothetical protein